MTTTSFDQYRFWATNAYQIGGAPNWKKEMTQQYTGGVALNIPGLPSHYGVPIGLQMDKFLNQMGGSSVDEVIGSDMTVEHAAEEEVERGEGMYGLDFPEDDKIPELYASDPFKANGESEPVNTTIDDGTYTSFLKAVGKKSSNRNNSNSKKANKMEPKKRTRRIGPRNK
jgi:hypothetical protein